MSITMQFTNSDLYPYGYFAIAAMGLANPGRDIDIQQPTHGDAADSILIFFNTNSQGGTTSIWSAETIAAVLDYAVPLILHRLAKELQQPIDFGVIAHAQKRMKELLANNHPDELISARRDGLYSRILHDYDPVKDAEIIQEAEEIILSVIRTATTEVLKIQKPAMAVTTRFGVALDMLLDGTADSITRKAWGSHQAVSIFSGAGGGELLVTKAVADNVWLSWTPSRDDIFATDWICSHHSSFPMSVSLCGEIPNRS